MRRDIDAKNCQRPGRQTHDNDCAHIPKFGQWNAIFGGSAASQLAANNAQHHFNKGNAFGEQTQNKRCFHSNLFVPYTGMMMMDDSVWCVVHVLAAEWVFVYETITTINAI